MQIRRSNLTSPHGNLTIAAVLFLSGIGSFQLFLSVNAIGWKSLSLFFAVALILGGIFRSLIFSLTSLPEGHCKRLVSSVAMLTGALYYIFYGQSIVWIALSWILLLMVILGLITALQGILVEGNMLRALLKAYEGDELPNLVAPFVYVLAEPGLGVLFGHRLVTATISSLARHRYSPAMARLSLPLFDDERNGYLWKYRHHVAMACVVSDSVRRYSVNFRKWTVSQAAALMVIRTPLGAVTSLERTFDDEAKSGYQICPGPTFLIYLRPFKDDTLTPATVADQTLECTHGIGNRQFDNVIAALVNRLASTSFPTGVSDSRLTDGARSLIQEVATGALPPIADSYLRFRLAQSNVERFLSLLDSIECLIKCSVIVLLVNRWIQEGVDVSSKRLAGRPPTLGSWIHFLQHLITDTTVPNELDTGICGFWTGDVFEVQMELIREVSDAGFPLQVHQRSTQSDWLEWFRDLRNVTRGHGVVTEKSIASFWHPLHEAFLEMISALRPLVLESVLVVNEPNDNQISLRGWIRGTNRAGSQFFQEPAGHEMLAVLKLPSDQSLPLHPLIVVQGNEVLLWDCLRKKENAIEFLNYSSGQREQLTFSEIHGTDPYEVWLKTCM